MGWDSQEDAVETRVSGQKRPLGGQEQWNPMDLEREGPTTAFCPKALIVHKGSRSERVEVDDSSSWSLS